MLSKRELIACYEVVGGDERLILKCAILDIEEDILTCGIDGRELDLQTLGLTGLDDGSDHGA